MAALAPDELVCDMAETYHVLDWRALGLPLAATLAGGLRETSRTCMALNHAQITTDTLLLGAMADSLQLLVWLKTKDAQHGRNRPGAGDGYPAWHGPPPQGDRLCHGCRV